MLDFGDVMPFITATIIVSLKNGHHMFIICRNITTDRGQLAGSATSILLGDCNTASKVGLLTFTAGN